MARTPGNTAITMGESRKAMALSGVVFSSVPLTNALSGTALSTFQAYTLPAKALNAAGKLVRLYAAASTAANTTSKTLLFTFGAVTVATVTTITASDLLVIQAIVARSTVTLQTSCGFMTRGSATVTATQQNALAAENLNTDIVIALKTNIVTGLTTDMTILNILMEVLPEGAVEI